MTYALSFPDAWEDEPWGEQVVKVGKKIFLFLNMAEGAARFADGFYLAMKLPESAEAALTFPFATPTGYGLGRSGWVSFLFAPGTKVPYALLCDWIDESYRAVATKSLVKQLEASNGPPLPSGR